MKKSVKIAYEKFGVKLTYDVTENKFYDNVENKDVVKYLKSVFTSRARFETRFVEEFRNVINRMYKLKEEGMLNEYQFADPEDFRVDKQMDALLELYDQVEPFTYAEAFVIENPQFRADVFGNVNITEMITELGHKRIKTAGKPVKHKQFDTMGNFTGYKEYDSIYEVHEVSGEKLGITGNVYALKCWCTSTEKEHWIWIEDQYKDDPLEAVASTFRIHKNLIPHIKELKRQGDILLVEMKEDVKPEGDIVPLSADQYFSLLTAQS